MTVSKRSENIPSFIVMDVLDRAVEMQRGGADVVHMEVGEPDFPSPAKVVEAGIEALRKGATHYTHSMGLPALREAIARHYDRKYGVEVDPGCILVTMGSSPAMLMTFATLLDPGDEMILPDPAYPCYPNMVTYVDGVPCTVPVLREDDFQYRPADIRSRIGPRTKGIILNSPANPTGCVFDPGVIEEIARLGPVVVSDEIYHGMIYEGEDHTVLEYTDEAFVISGFSKLWAMTGWRLGWVIAPRRFVRPLQKVQQNFFISPADFTQHAGIAALEEEHPEIAEMLETYRRRRRYLLDHLGDVGLPVDYRPRGAFYLFLDVSRYTRDCYRFAFEILEKAHVAVTPGVDFGERGECCIRLSYANSLENLKKGVQRLGAFLEGK
jgi:aspartate/methionine/tyrosine aminotransferase